MRDHGTEADRAEPHQPTRTRGPDGDESSVARAAAAAVSGQRAAVGPAGALGLQRAVGNAGLTSVLGPPSDEATIQREMSGSETEAPLYPSHGEGEEEI